MAKMTLEQLRQMRNDTKSEMHRRETEGKEVHIIVGMGTCGIAAGAKDTLDGFLDAVQKQGLANVSVKQTGCMGLCYKEPTVEIRVPGVPDTIYGNVDQMLAEEIVASHIVNKKLVDGHIIDRPAGDILAQ